MAARRRQRERFEPGEVVVVLPEVRRAHGELRVGGLVEWPALDALGAGEELIHVAQPVGRHRVQRQEARAPARVVHVVETDDPIPGGEHSAHRLLHPEAAGVRERRCCQLMVRADRRLDRRRVVRRRGASCSSS